MITVVNSIAANVTQMMILNQRLLFTSITLS